VFVGHQPKPNGAKAERNLEVVSAPLSVSHRKRREPLNGEASRDCYKIKQNRININ